MAGVRLGSGLGEERGIPTFFEEVGRFALLDEFSLFLFVFGDESCGAIFCFLGFFLRLLMGGG